jgi:hypothetical protein
MIRWIWIDIFQTFLFAFLSPIIHSLNILIIIHCPIDILIFHSLHKTHIFLLLQYWFRTSTTHITYTYTLSFLMLFTYSSYTIHQVRCVYSLFFSMMSNRQRRKKRIGERDGMLFWAETQNAKITKVMRDDCCFLISMYIYKTLNIVHTYLWIIFYFFYTWCRILDNTTGPCWRHLMSCCWRIIIKMND